MTDRDQERREAIRLFTPKCRGMLLAAVKECRRSIAAKQSHSLYDSVRNVAKGEQDGPMIRRPVNLLLAKTLTAALSTLTGWTAAMDDRMRDEALGELIDLLEETDAQTADPVSAE